MAEAAAGRRVLLTDPVVQVSLVRAGARVISLFSPEARPALARDADPLATLAELRRRGVRFVVVTRYNPVHDHWVYQYPWFAWLRQMPVEATGQLYFVYDLYSARFMAAARPDTTRPGETPVVR